MNRAAALTPLAVLAAGCASALLQPGVPVTGLLAPADPTFTDGAHFRGFLLSVRRGDTITALLSSDDFDAMLVLTDWDGRALAENDDGGGDCNARLRYVAPWSRLLRVYATSSSGGEIGAFRLELWVGSPPPPPADTTCRGFGAVTGAIRPGQSAIGELDPGDAEFDQATYFEHWVLAVTRPETLTVDVASLDFDPRVLLLRARGERLAADDDGGPGCDARLVYAPEDARPLRIVVTTAVAPPRQTGTYVLRVRRRALPRDSARDCRFGLPLEEAAGPARRIAVGETVPGELGPGDPLLPGDSTPVQRWAVPGTAGQTVTVDLASSAFDAYLVVFGPGLDPPLEDDDSAGGCDARVTLTFPETAEYEILVNTAQPRATGPFRLSVRTRAPAPTQAVCQPPAVPR